MHKHIGQSSLHGHYYHMAHEALGKIEQFSLQPCDNRGRVKYGRRWLEERDWQLYWAISCHVLSAMCLESFINAYATERLTNVPDYIMTELSMKDRTEFKYLLYPVLAGAGTPDKSQVWYRELRWVFEMRNRLMHDKPVVFETTFSLDPHLVSHRLISGNDIEVDLATAKRAVAAIELVARYSKGIDGRTATWWIV